MAMSRAIDENNEEVACFLIRSGCDLNAPRRPGPAGQGQPLSLKTVMYGSGSVCFWASWIRIQPRIRILRSSSRNCKKILDAYCFVTSFFFGGGGGLEPIYAKDHKLHHPCALIFSRIGNAYYGKRKENPYL